MSDPSWDNFVQREERGERAPSRLDEICAQLFTTPDGRELLIELRKLHFDSIQSPLADERALRVRIARQHFVRELELARDRGLAAAANRKTT